MFLFVNSFSTCAQSAPAVAQKPPIYPSLRFVLNAALVLALGACASAPRPAQNTLVEQQPLVVKVNKRHRHIEQFVNAEALSGTPRIAVPAVRIADGAFDKSITAPQAQLVANHAARSVCLALAKYAELSREGGDGVLSARLVVTAIKPTSGAAAGASFVAGQFSTVPLVPTRFPGGLGGLAVEGELRTQEDQQIVLMRWARGASSNDDPMVSAVGDAWQLAEVFGKEFTRSFLDTNPKKWGIQRQRLPSATAKANRALCAEYFGKLSLMGRAGGMLLPLAPGAMDPGAPKANAETDD